MKILEALNGKKILIWGYGREGRSTERFLHSFAFPKNVKVFEGPEEQVDFSAYDLVVKSPGIPLKAPHENVTSQTALFLSAFRDQTIGITGTKGKSTTSTLLYEVLKAVKGDNVLLVGNIGLPCLDYIDRIDEDTLIVFEMSCHQLNDLRVSPHVAVFLNLYEEHLDYYGTKERYFQAKSMITRNQKPEDFVYLGENVPPIETPAKKTVIPFGTAENTDGGTVKNAPERFLMKLPGEHNQFNARFVFKICTEVLGLPEPAVREAIANFKGLRHRLEFVANIKKVDYYDDSISTIPEAAIAALSSIGNAKTVLIGGMDRGISYALLTDYIRKHPEYRYVLMYASGERIFREVSGLPYVSYREDLESAVRQAKAVTPEGYACILSPAAASYGYFKNFEERGDRFAALVREDK